MLNTLQTMFLTCRNKKEVEKIIFFNRKYYFTYDVGRIKIPVGKKGGGEKIALSILIQTLLRKDNYIMIEVRQNFLDKSKYFHFTDLCCFFKYILHIFM